MGCCGDGAEDKYQEEGETPSTEEEKKGGKPLKHDPNFKGPIKSRSCTDVICCILFLICFLGFLAVGLWAYANGDPNILLYPTDSKGNLCGYGDFEDRPFLFFFDLIQCGRVGPSVVFLGCPTPQICVQECPHKNWGWFANLEDRSGLICQYNVTNERKNSDSVEDLVRREDCAAYYLKSTPLAGRCIPTFLEDAVKELSNTSIAMVDMFNKEFNLTDLHKGTKFLAVFLSAKEYGMRVYQDVRASWVMILVGLIIAVVWCFLWICLMRWIAGFMVWFTIFLFIGVFGAVVAYCGYKFYTLRNLPGSDGLPDKFTTNFDYYLNLTYTWIAIGSLAALILLIIVIVVIFLRKRILIAIAVIQEASKALGHMISALFWPLFPWVLQVVLFGFWGASAICLASVGSIETAKVNRNHTLSDTDAEVEIKKAIQSLAEETPCNPNENGTLGEICTFVKYGGDQFTIYLQFFQLFMLFWVANFIVAVGQLTLSGAFASYYWALEKPKDIPALPVLSSLGRALRYNMGTAAFGSLLLAIVKFKRFILEYVDNKLKGSTHPAIKFILKYHLGTAAFGSLLIAIVQIIRVFLEYLDRKLKTAENQVAKFLIKCLKCCFWCLEKFIKFLNKNAYIMTAIYGYNFCRAASLAFKLILRNIIRVVVVDKVADFLILVGKLVVVGVVTVIAFVFFSGDLADNVPIQSISDYISDFTPQLNYYLIPVIIIGLGSYVIASAFFSVYSMGVDTIFLCFLHDLEVNDGSAEKPYRMSRSLMKILGKKNAPVKGESNKVE